MAATLWLETNRGRRKIVDLRYGATSGEKRGLAGFVDFHLYSGHKKQPFFIRVLPVFSEARFAPTGAHVFLERKTIETAVPGHGTETVQSVRIRSEIKSIFDLLPALEGITDVRVRRISRWPTRLFNPDKILIEGF